RYRARNRRVQHRRFGLSLAARRVRRGARVAARDRAGESAAAKGGARTAGCECGADPGRQPRVLRASDDPLQQRLSEQREKRRRSGQLGRLRLGTETRRCSEEAGGRDASRARAARHRGARHGGRRAPVSSDCRGTKTGRARGGAEGRKQRIAPARSKPLRSARSAVERRRQVAVEPGGIGPPLCAGPDGPGERPGRLREGARQGSVRTRMPFPWKSFLLVAAAAQGGCGAGDVKADARSPKAVRLVSVESSDGVETTTYSVTLAPNAQVDLAFRIAGYVVDVRRLKTADGRSRELEPGDLLPSGTTLARVRSSDYDAAVDKAHGARDEAGAGIAAAEATLAEAQAGLTQAEFDYGRISTLWQQESITKPAYDGARARLDAARAKVDAAAPGAASARQRAAAAVGQAHEAEIARSDIELRAPFDAILLERRIDIGTLVSPAVPASTIAPPPPLQ